MGEDSNWSDYLPKVLEIYNNLQHSSTGFSPNVVETGEVTRKEAPENNRLRIALESAKVSKDIISKEAIQEKARKNNEASAARSAVRYNKKTKTIIFEVGAQVLVKDDQHNRRKNESLYPWKAVIMGRTLNNLYTGSISKSKWATRRLRVLVTRHQPEERREEEESLEMLLVHWPAILLQKMNFLLTAMMKTPTKTGKYVNIWYKHTEGDVPWGPRAVADPLYETFIGLLPTMNISPKSKDPTFQRKSLLQTNKTRVRKDPWGEKMK